MAPVPTAAANGINLTYETFGDPADPTILLIMGLGAQMVAWDESFCEALVARGFHVVRFDNRDIGTSTWIDSPGFDVSAAVLGVLSGETIEVPYLLSDMADDTAGLLDALGLDAVHVVGASMGGMIGQALAIAHPERVRSLTSIMSTTGDPDVGQPSPEMGATLLAPRPTDRAASVEFSVAITKAISSPDHYDEAAARARAEREHERGMNPIGVARQLVAILASGSRAHGLAGLQIPVLVVHGRQDQLVPLSGGERTAATVPGADLLVIDDMAHDVPAAHVGRITDAIVANAAKAPAA